MTGNKFSVATGPFLGTSQRRLPSDLIDDHEPVFRGHWHSKERCSRFGDSQWQISGADPAHRRSSWTISFESFSPEWSLIVREALFLHINQADYRHLVEATPNNLPTGATLRASSLDAYHASFRRLMGLAEELDLGLPNTWLTHHVEALQEKIRAEDITGVGRIIKLLANKHGAMTLGGIRWDPMRGTSIAAWEGATATSRTLSNRGISPEAFHRIVGNALFYVEHAAQDILAARIWRDSRQSFRAPKGSRNSRARYEERYPDHADVISERTRLMHEAILAAGGVPTATARHGGGASAAGGEPCQASLRLAAGVAKEGSGITKRFIEGRIAAGTPLVAGGLPLQITNVTRPDGTVGPWRVPFCAQSIDLEINTLIHACKIVVMAFTAMRDSEMSGIPRHGWRTTWHGAPAITAPEIKTRAGQPLRWWATPPVITACEVLEQLVDWASPYLFLTTKSRRTRSASDVPHGDNWVAVQSFVRRMNTDPHLLGLPSVPAGWGAVAGRSAETSLPPIHPRAFRFTLSSISNFVALGDVAFQQQAKHAHITMSHSYAANGATTEWSRVVLNNLANTEAEARTARTVDLYMGIWSGDSELAGHAGRDLTRTVRQLLNGLGIEPYDENADENMLDQFSTRVLTAPELAQAIRSTATILYPGNVAHCLRYVTKMECASDTLEPIQGLCRPESCANVLLDTEQQIVIRERHTQVREWLGIPRLPTAQREVFQRREQRLSAQLRTQAP